MNNSLTWRKIFSGQFLFTVVTAGVFAYAVVNKLLDGEKVYGIIMLVIAFYFGSGKTTQSGGKNETNISNSTVNPSVTKPSES